MNFTTMLRLMMVVGPRMIVNGQWRQVAYRLGTRLRGLDLDFVPVAELGAKPDRDCWYSDSGGPYLEAVLRKLDLRPSDTILDLGCGKGGALITFAKFPHARLGGVDIAPKLLEIAKSNLARMGINEVSLHCSNAAEFTAYDDYSHIYMYNPFLDVVMESVVANIQRSLERKPRDLKIIYLRPKCHDLLMRTSLFQEVTEYPCKDTTVRVYTHRSDSGPGAQSTKT